MGDTRAAVQAAKSKAGIRRGLQALLVTGALLWVSSNAAALCAYRACAAVGDADRDGETDTAQVIAFGNGASATATDDHLAAETWALGATSGTEATWYDADGDLDPETLWVEHLTTVPTDKRGASLFGLLYVEDWDEGDVVDYAYATANVGISQGGSVSAGFVYKDASKDLQPGYGRSSTAKY